MPNRATQYFWFRVLYKPSQFKHVINGNKQSTNYDQGAIVNPAPTHTHTKKMNVAKFTFFFFSFLNSWSFP